MPHVHNALHHFIGVQDAYRKVVGEQDPSFNGIERASETLTPTVNLWERPEWAVLRGEVLWSAFHVQAAVVGELSFVGIRNPAGSGLLAVITRYSCLPGGGIDWGVFHGVISASDVDGSEQLVPRDTRLNLSGVTRLVKIHGAGGAAIGNDAFEQHRLVNGQETVFTNEHVLSPGFELRFYGLTTNTATNVWVVGYARPALPGELA